MSGLGSMSSATLSLSDAMKKVANENLLYTTLLNNPDKRAKVLELLTQEGIVGRDENLSPNSAKSNKYNSPIKRLQKQNNESVLNGSPKSKPTIVRMESPSALGRRRALQRLQSDSSAEDHPQKPTSPSFVGTPVPFERLLEGVVAYCEIRSNGEDRSSAIKIMMQSMGARIKEDLCRSVTHVILKDGLYSTYRKAKLIKSHVVSVLWLEAVRRHKFRVPESKFPAICADANEADLTKICQEMQKDYDDVIQDELNKTTEIDSRRKSSPRKYVTNRKKSTKSRSTIYGSDCSGFKDAHNRTEVASPYKYKCDEPDLSESDSYISVGSTTRKSLEIVPCSQDHPTSLSIYHNSPQLTKVTEEEEEDLVEVFPESNLARNIKDSFELEKASKIRSPDSLLNKSKQKDLTKRNKDSLENDSLGLHISTTDESNLNSTGNKSKSNNTSSFKNQLDDITPIINKSSNSSGKISSEGVNWHLHISEESNLNPLKSNESNVDNLPNNNLESNEELSRPSSSISTASSDTDINKNKTRRRTAVGLKRPPKKDSQLNNLNQTVSCDVSSKTPTKIQRTPKIKPIASCIESSTSSIETNDTTIDIKKQNEVRRNTRRQTIYQTNIDVEDNQPQKSRRKTLAKVNLESKAKSDEINEEIAEENNLAVDNHNNITNTETEVNQPKKSRRRTLGKVNTDKKTKSVEINEVIAEETEKHNSTVDNQRSITNTDETDENQLKKSRRKTVGKVNSENKTKSAEINEEIAQKTEKPTSEVNSSIRKSRRKTIANTNKADEDKNNNPLSSDSSADKTKRRVRKLYNRNQSISASLINWDDEPDPDPKSSSVSPPKRGKYQIPIDLPKILSAKAQKKTKSTIKSTTKSVPAKSTKAVNFDTKSKRKSVRALNFNSTSSETSDSDVKSVNPSVQTPSRRSVRIAKTPVKIFKVAETESDSEIEKNTNRSSGSSVSVIKGTITPRIRKSRFISSQETESSQRTPKTQPKISKRACNTPNSRTQLLKEESKRRSTLDFVPQRSKKSLEELRQSQKPKPPTKVPGIVCTRLHKSDVHVFQQIVKKLGGFVAQDEVTKRTTHLVAGDPSRTVNMLRAIVRGLWVVKKEWLYKSLEAGKWLEEEDFEFTEFSPAVQKCRIMKQSFGPLFSMDLFNTCGPIFISRGSSPRFSDLEELVELCGGRFVRFLKDAQIIVGEYATHESAVCVNEKWILDSITQNKMKKCKGYLLERPRSPVL